MSPAEPIGVARYIRMAEKTSSAEVAVTVVDSHQQRGLGTLLLAYLACRAIGNDIEEFFAVVLADNYRMLEVFTELGSSKKLTSEGEVEVRIPLFADATQYSQTPAGDVFRQVFESFTSSG